jgi:putative colanic acid biosynthesis acetyltransferase WcaF
MRLNDYSRDSYQIGAPFWKRVLWYFVGSPLVQSKGLPFSFLKVFVLKRFGAKIGRKVRIKGGVQVKFPWKLSIGDYAWIGENAWIDNLAEVYIGAHCCLSQAVYLCTGNHDWNKTNFDLIVKPIHLSNHVWLGAKSMVAPGVNISEGAVLTLGSVATKDLEPWSIYRGNPALFVRKRGLKSEANI